MENEEKNMSGEESIRIISEMINTTKVNFRQSSFHLIFWGWIVLICSLAEYTLMNFTELVTPWYAWFLTLPAVFVSLLYGFYKGKRAKYHTYGDLLNMWTWLGFLATTIILCLLMRNSMENISPFILMLAGFPTFLTGFIIRFRPLVYGGISIWLFSLVAGFGSDTIAPLAVPAAMITGYLIPGYLIRNRFSDDTI